MINETIVEPSASRPASPTDGWRINTRSARKFTIRNTIQKTIVASTSPVRVVEKPSKIAAAEDDADDDADQRRRDPDSPAGEHAVDTIAPTWRESTRSRLAPDDDADRR